MCMASGGNSCASVSASSRLIRVLDDDRLEVDDNPCENAIRPFVMLESFCTSSSSVWKH